MEKTKIEKTKIEKTKIEKNNRLAVIFRIILGLIGLAGFVVFLIPYFTFGVINIGNLTGLCISVILLVLGIVWPSFIKMVSSIRKRKVGKIVTNAILIILTAGLILVFILTGFMIYGANRKSKNIGLDIKTEAKTVIVLGCQVKNDKPSLCLKERIDAAYEYLIDNPKAVAVLSGGMGKTEKISEGECMKRELTKMGISQDRLYVEDKSTSTRENFTFSNIIVKENNLSQNIVIVTNEFHEYRAYKIAENLGLDSSAYSAKTAWWLLPTYYVRELYGILYQWIF